MAPHTPATSHPVLSLLLLSLLVLSSIHYGGGDGISSSGGDIASAAATRDRLAAFILVTDLHYKGQDRLGKLKACLRLLRAHLLPYTPTDVFVFTAPEHEAPVRKAVGGRGTAQVHVVSSRVWKAPRQAEDKALWHGYWGTTYR